jgi:hypothetical protein
MNGDFIEAAIDAGFSESMAEFMDQWLAKYPHGHSVDEIDGIDELVDEKVDEALEGGADEEEE